MRAVPLTARAEPGDQCHQDENHHDAHDEGDAWIHACSFVGTGETRYKRRTTPPQKGVVTPWHSEGQGSSATFIVRNAQDGGQRIYPWGWSLSSLFGSVR